MALAVSGGRGSPGLGVKDAASSCPGFDRPPWGSGGDSGGCRGYRRCAGLLGGSGGGASPALGPGEQTRGRHASSPRPSCLSFPLEPQPDCEEQPRVCRLNGSGWFRAAWMRVGEQSARPVGCKIAFLEAAHGPGDSHVTRAARGPWLGVPMGPVCSDRALLAALILPCSNPSQILPCSLPKSRPIPA